MSAFYEVIPAKRTDDHVAGDLMAKIPILDPVFAVSRFGMWEQWETPKLQLVGGSHKRLGLLVEGRRFCFFCDEVKNCFEPESISGIQWLPVSLIYPSGAPGPEYHYMYIKTHVPALDVERSRVTFGSIGDLKNQILAVSEPVLRVSAVPEGLDVFRLQEVPALWFVSERVRKLSAAMGLDFWDFVPVRTV